MRSSFVPRAAYAGVAAACLMGLALPSFAQYAKDKVNLLARVSLTTLGATSGNDCWGYTSPSGREYALMGCNNKFVFVEITNPAAPVIIGSIPHPSSTWADAKVYGSHAYLVSEASGTGIQVVDMSNIDNGQITLVRTIASPGRSHNISLDTRSGFIYTAGSREGTGTTTCFSLADPANPVQVGPASMTANYQHDIMPYTYTSGPYAGRQFIFGASEGRGVDIHDVTDKNNPVLIKRIPYPYAGYCHQLWMSEDEKYLYVDDEFDESNEGFNTRTIIVDIATLEDSHYMTEFYSAAPSIDHNQYIRDGFTFQANYRSGLRIYDLNDDPMNPRAAGFFDTYPADDNRGYDGAWSNYVYFPSGRVIVSDINRGLFILDVTEALTKTLSPTAFNTVRGIVLSGGLQEILTSDDTYLTIRPGITFSTSEAPIQITLDGKSFTRSPKSFKFALESAANQANIQQTMELFNFTANTWEVIDTRATPTTDTNVEIAASGALNRFVNQTDKSIRARLSWKASGPVFSYPWNVRIDRAVWTVGG